MKSLKDLSRRKVWNDGRKVLQRLIGTTSSEIQIPARIERSSTDVLKALESTVQRDITAAHYKYHDDPFLLPQSKSDLRVFAMARESGRKAAMWVHKEHTDLFPHDLSVPVIEAFQPPVVYTEKSQVSEEILMKMINQANKTEALKIYGLLEGNVSNQAKQSLLELLCYYNGSIPVAVLSEERWFQRRTAPNKKTWVSNLEIEELFSYLKNQDPATAAAAYNAMICGMAKHWNVDQAWALYKECQKERIPLTLNVYNHMFDLIPLVVEGDNKPVSLVHEVSAAMVANGIRPNLHTLNSILKVADALPSTPAAIGLLRSIFAEFKRFNIAPSLTSYYYALRVFGREGDRSYSTVMDILKALKGKSLTLQDERDTLFFVAAMDMASEQFSDRRIAEAIHEILLHGNNYQFINESYKESMYFRAYVSLVLATETFSEFYKFYEKIVPNIYIPEPSIMTQMLKALEPYPSNVVRDYVPKLWSHVIMFNMLDRENVVNQALTLMRKNCALPKDSPLHEMFAEAAWTIWTHIQESHTKQRKFTLLQAHILGDLAVLLLRNDCTDHVLDVLAYLSSDNSRISGILHADHLNEMFETSISGGHIEIAFTLLEYVINAQVQDYDVTSPARKIYSTFALSDKDKAQLVNLVGKEILEMQLPDSK